MLARTILSAAELKISEKELAALLAVLTKLEREEIPHAENIKHIWSWNITKPMTHFNMAWIYSEHECGTAGCILGWARHLTGDQTLFEHEPPAVANLFCTGSDNYQELLAKGRFGGSDRITPAHAAEAIRNFLSCGEAKWAEVLTV